MLATTVAPLGAEVADSTTLSGSSRGVGRMLPVMRADTLLLLAHRGMVFRRCSYKSGARKYV